MTLEQAREFFRRFDGSPFHMSREQPQLLAEFEALNIPAEIRDGWRLELANEYLEKITPDDPKSWSFFSSLASVLMAIRSFSGVQEEMLIEGIKRQAESDLPARTITLETVCGRTYDHHDGIIAYFRKNGLDLEKLREAADLLIGADHETDDERMKRAIDLYRSLI